MGEHLRKDGGILLLERQQEGRRYLDGRQHHEVAREPQEVHQGQQDGLRRPEEAPGPRRHCRVPQEDLQGIDSFREASDTTSILGSAAIRLPLRSKSGGRVTADESTVVPLFYLAKRRWFIPSRGMKLATTTVNAR